MSADFITPLVEEFITKFEATNAPWNTLLEEELKEFEEALAEVLNCPDDISEGEARLLVAAAAKEYCDLIYVIGGASITDPEGGPSLSTFTRIVQARRAAPVLFGFSQADMELCFREVHRSNMSKLGEDGKPVRREDGKVLKGPNYSPANLLPILFPDTRSVN